MQKPADTRYPIHDLLRARWSPRAFSSHPIEDEKLLQLFEAARWSPSGGNWQPWSFVVATQKDAKAHQKMVEILTGRNPLWAGSAPVLVLAVARVHPESGRTNQWAPYDLGQAVAHMSVQASALGLHVRQMGGFDAHKACESFHIPDDYQPMTVIAIGYYGDPDALPDELRQLELAPRTRKPVSEFVFAGQWGQPLDLSAAGQGSDHQVSAL